MTTYFLISLSIIIFLLCLNFSYINNQRKLNSWKKKLNLSLHRNNFLSIFQNIDGFAISKKARQNKVHTELIYGEIEFYSFIALLCQIEINKNTVFYDLGCGVGKAVIACSMVFNPKKAVGIELIPELYKSATHAKQVFKKVYDHHTIDFILSDFKVANLDEATCIFINATALFDSTWQEMSLIFELLQKLEYVITVSKIVKSSKFTVLSKTSVQMSWGIATVYIHKASPLRLAPKFTKKQSV